MKPTAVNGWLLDTHAMQRRLGILSKDPAFDAYPVLRKAAGCRFHFDGPAFDAYPVLRVWQ